MTRAATDAGAAYLFDGGTGRVAQDLPEPHAGVQRLLRLFRGGDGEQRAHWGYYDDTGATNTGAAYLFDGATGALVRTFQKPTPAGSDYFGYSVAAMGNNVLIGGVHTTIPGPAMLGPRICSMAQLATCSRSS